MDELDRKIIGLLQVDGRASNAKIAREVGVSEGTVRRRLRRLIQDDVVKVIAVPNLEKLGYATTALIGLQTGPGKSDEVAEAIASALALWQEQCQASERILRKAIRQHDRKSRSGGKKP